MGIKRDVALTGMHSVKPDLGALIVWKLKGENGSLQFVNGMAANDPVSTLQIWKFVIDRYPTTSGSAVFFNSRDDRPLRTNQMLELTFEEIKPEHFIIRGDKIASKVNRLIHHSPETKVQIFPLDDKIDSVSKSILDLPEDILVFAIGNQVGEGQIFYRYYQKVDTMIEISIGLGIILSLILSEALGVTAGGIIVPGYTFFFSMSLFRCYPHFLLPY